MSSAQHILAAPRYAPMPAGKQRQSREHLLIGIVMVLMAFWLPLMAHLVVEKRQGSAFGAASATSHTANQMAGSARGFAP